MNKIDPHRRLLLTLGALALAGPVAAGPLDWIGGERVQGNGSVKIQAREPGHFTGISLAVPGSLELRIGATESLTIETDDNIMAKIETVVEDGILKIRPLRRNVALQPSRLKIVVQAAEIDHLGVGGSGSIAADALRTPRLQVDIGGSGSIAVRQLDADALSVTVGGSGGLKAAGTVRKAAVTIGGSGSVDLGQLKAAEASANVAGSGQVTLNVHDALSVSIAGSGDVNYYGDPKLSRTVAGSGQVRRLGPSR